MSEPIAYLNGRFFPERDLYIRPQDMGFMLGVTLAEQVRTFAGKLFEWSAHKQRLQRSLEIVGVEVDISQIEDAADQLVTHNYSLLTPGSDLGLTIFVTPGIYPTYNSGQESTRTVALHTYPLPFSLWANKYTTGQRCLFVSVPQVSAACWPRELKCRSRMHYYLADREAQAKDPAARAILLDKGNINEASTANVVAYFEGEGLVSPPLDSILPGASLRYLERLSRGTGIDFVYRDISPIELKSAREILLTSTSPCILPVSSLDGQSFVQRECFDRLLSAWSDRVGVDVKAQALRFVE